MKTWATISLAAAVLLGAGVRGNTLVGATSDTGMSPIPWDVATNLPSDTGVILKVVNGDWKVE